MCKRTVTLGIGLPLVLALLVHGFVDQTYECVARLGVPSTRTTPGRALAPAVRPAYHGIIGDSPQMAEIFARIDKVARSEEHTSELQSPCNLVCRLLLEKKKKIQS